MRIAGRYEVSATLGQGGMGVVYRATIPRPWTVRLRSRRWLGGLVLVAAMFAVLIAVAFATYPWTTRAPDEPDALKNETAYSPVTPEPIGTAPTPTPDTSVAILSPPSVGPAPPFVDRSQAAPGPGRTPSQAPVSTPTPVVVPGGDPTAPQVAAQDTGTPTARTAAQSANPSPSPAEPPVPPEPPATRAATLLGRAAQSEKTRDWETAIRNYESARALDLSLSELVATALARIRAQRISEGADAMKCARQYDAVARVDEAIIWFERAFRSLPEDHPDRQAAGTRLRELKSSR